MARIRWTHSCVTVDDGSGVLVVDPGIWSEPEALLRADAVLLTHEHSDHADLLRIVGSELPVWAPSGADLRGMPFHPVEPGAEVSVAGFTVRGVGGRHARVLPEQDPCPNLGYVIDTSEGALYHPGDALVVPEETIETLLVPLQASWLKTADAVDFARAIDPERAFGIHDGQVNRRAIASVGRWLAEFGCTAYRSVEPGSQV
ncbi:MBL fold metallo-hydrolase [Flexivirga oryzae]|uniref:L-ascorbate metabolism protein UlaG (Beta-lactamase superfamily) n=1 Tax=Flexivirga oryzae TaxID=1794944 RepID=A0A839N6V7_9MICO|nr:MBL fold metallo-hydrolase [Flexivirga oryzae]MBB2891833.1 L-ascorbate metabolism protein UlaG (beta-lactamase superfamily) [Flexivirga oryzae]